MRPWELAEAWESWRRAREEAASGAGPTGHELQSELTPQTPGCGELASLPQGGGLLPCLARGGRGGDATRNR